jgi:hypothetical protein
MGGSVLQRLFRRRRTASASAALALESDRPEAEAAMVPADATVPEAAPRTWSPARLAQAEALWGEGFVGPGGAEEIRRLTAPFGLSAAHSLLIVGAGAGGSARAMAAELGVWVTACESDPDLAEVAARRLQRAGAALAKRASVARWDPAAPSFGVAAFHHALACDVLSGPRREAVLGAIVRAVKPGGQVMVMQSVDPTGREMADIVAMFQLLGCDLRVTEDETMRHARQVLQGWRLLVRQMHGSRPAPAQAAALVAEAEYWLLRLRRIRQGRLKTMRWGAIVG